MANLGELIDSIYAKDEQIVEANAQVSLLEKQKKEIEDELLALMHETGTQIASSMTGNKAQVVKKIHPKIADAEKFYQFVLRKKALHLFQRRIAETAYYEMKESLGNKPIPGLSEFEQTRLKVTKG